ncbi:MAG: type II toxin-antitoxin system Phd/YefM family antitoxin [Oscillospiraceae bacterium]|nr:type II toxin-antitoxin system Phd/YefM family antitoxin [Oscillospiraceae bacterium]
MPQIIPIRDLKNTAEISEKCHATNEPLFITKNGYGDMVIMSIENYEKMTYMNDIYLKLEAAELSIKQDNTISGNDSIRKLREKYEL